jgi:hypothetical protein
MFSVAPSASFSTPSFSIHLLAPGTWEVYGIDNHSNALDRAAALAERSGADVTLLDRDLRRPDSLADFNGRVALVHGIPHHCMCLVKEPGLFFLLLPL